MKKSTYAFIIVISIILNFIVFKLVIEFGNQNSFSPVDPLLLQKYYPFLMFFLLPFLALAWSSKVAGRDETNVSIKEKIKYAFLKMLLSLNLFVLCWMLITGFL